MLRRKYGRRDHRLPPAVARRNQSALHARRGGRRSLHTGRRHAAGQHLLHDGAGDHRCRLLVQAQAHAVVGCFVQRNFGYRALGLHARSARDAPRKAAHGNALGQSADPGVAGEKLGVWGDNNLVVTGEGAPTKAPDRAGQFYVDTKNNAVYHSVGNGAVSDWKNA